MSKEVFLRRLRPYLFTGYRRAQSLRPVHTTSLGSDQRAKSATHDSEKRVAQLEANRPIAECYPRLQSSIATSRIEQTAFETRNGHLKPGEVDTAAQVTLAGRVRSVRTAGSKLCFVDIETGDAGFVQAVCQLDKLADLDPNLGPTGFKNFSKLARRGDTYSILGHPHRTARGELSVLATELPQLLSPSLHQVPPSFEDVEARARNRHVDMLVNPIAVQTIRTRHHVEEALQDFFNRQGFIKVSTPILSASAGGATARAFVTEAVELAGENLNLRIAPELWLKRLIVGGMEKIYELGPAFRNEGVDFTHNPEFNTCEFYEAYATLDDLMEKTQDLLCHISEKLLLARNRAGSSHLPLQTHSDISQVRYERVEFIPGLEERLGQKLPDLESSEALSGIRDIFEQNDVNLPTNPTLPRLLDALAALHLEPLSASGPTFILHHPACMSPLSKHFVCSKTGQSVAARAELFIDGREYANMYEEENSPFEQRRKFEEQLKQREIDAEAMELDESYLRALEWGMPPTGGWGCGIDRLVMLFAGRDRIADVLTFGSLRNVVGLRKTDKR